MAFVAALDSFGQGLSDLAAAQDLAALKAAVSKAGSAISSIAAMAGPVAPAAGPAVKTVSTGAARLFGKIADAERLETLRIIVRGGYSDQVRRANPEDASCRHSIGPLMNREMVQITKLNATRADLPVAKAAAQVVITDTITYDTTAAGGFSDALDRM